MHHTKDVADSLTILATTPHGLTVAEATMRRDRDGPNRLAQRAPRPAWKKLLDQFRNVLVYVLLAAAILASVVGDVTDAIVIVVVILFNAGVGFFQERRAQATLAALEKMLATHARVLRDGAALEIASSDIVVGDVVLLDAGDRVPADGRVIESHDAELAEAALTGESSPVPKHPGALPSGEHPLAERSNMVFMNTVVTRGRLKAAVTAVAMNTEMGRIAGLLGKAKAALTPLQIQLGALGKHLAILAAVVVTAVFVIGVARGDSVVQAIMISVALAVAAIPEGLPAVVTVTLAIGMRRMAKDHAVVKTLAAVETLGATSVICCDKTGTLTLGEMTARELVFGGRVFTVSGEGYSKKGEITAADGALPTDLAPLLVPLAACNDASINDGKLVGDPTEGALLAVAAKGGVDPVAFALERPRIAEIPFDSTHKLMATFHRPAGSAVVTMLVKGAPDVLLARCRHTEGARSTLQAHLDRLAGRAMRVLAAATREIPSDGFDPAGDLMKWADELDFVGLVGMVDPPRAEARDAIDQCRAAGIRVKMITGDNRLTASAVARELGLEGATLSGAELDALDDDALSKRVEETVVFARVAPEHKVRIVGALQARGHVVAMTGDGVNDAPALERADIGVAMGVSGSEVAKEAAAMVLTDDNFVTIVGAVKEGRTIYDNIVKFVRFQLSTNLGAIVTVLGAQVLGLPTPFSAIQILWINIIMDGPPAMSLGLEAPRQGAMDEPPRPRSARILTLARFGHLLAFGAIMATGTLGVLAYGLRSGPPERAVTLAFTTFVMFQIFNVFNARAERASTFRPGLFTNGRLWASLGVVLAFQAVVVHVEVAQSLFHTSALSLVDWLLCASIGASVLALEEARKALVRLLTPGGSRGPQPIIPRRAAGPASGSAAAFAGHSR